MNKETQFICPQESHFSYKDTDRLNVKREKDVSSKQCQRRAGEAILLSDKIDFKVKKNYKGQRMLHIGEGSMW